MVKMARTIWVAGLLGLVVALVLSGRPGNARAGDPAREAPAGEVLCVPALAGDSAAGCSPAGPAVYLERMASSGIQFPIEPIPAAAPDPQLAAIDYQYARVTRDRAALYGSANDAARQDDSVRRLESGFDFISYSRIVEERGHKVFKLSSGEWMYGGDLSRVTPSRFQGLELLRTPDRPFGWVVHPFETKRSPGYEIKDDTTGNEFFRYDLVQVYGEAMVADQRWYQVGPDEWVDERMLGLVMPRYSAPKGVTNGRWIEINLYEQTVAVYEKGQLVFATLTSSGLPGWWTRPGLFKIYIKLNADTMRGAFEPDRSDYYYLQDVPWTMYFDESRALHGAYWHNGFGYPRSHGCVNLAPGDAQWIFNWAREGDWVYVWDPSGRTPVEEDLYSTGGA